MSKVQELHQQAMDLAEQADLTKLHGNVATTKEILKQALVLEAEAAGMLIDDLSAEPTRSVLNRSAATLVIERGELQQAEKLIAVALAGLPPPNIEVERKDLLIQVNLHRWIYAMEIWTAWAFKLIALKPHKRLYFQRGFFALYPLCNRLCRYVVTL